MAQHKTGTMNDGTERARWNKSGAWTRHWLWVWALVLAVGAMAAGCAAPMSPGTPVELQSAAEEQVTRLEPGSTSLLRTVDHALGTVEVPADPQRVVVLDAMDNVLALGIRPVGAANWMGTATGEQAAFPSYLDQETLAEIEWLGSNQQPSLERIVSLQPDLILGRTTWHEAIYDELSSIAPTFLVDASSEMTWKEQLAAYALALNRVEAGESLLAAYHQRAAAIQTALETLESSPLVSVVRFDPERIVIYGPEIFAGSVLADAGVARPPHQAEIARSEQISLEEIPRIDGDVLFPIAANPQESLLHTLQENPLWSRLQAVADDRVYPVSFDVWIGGWTITGAHLILDDLERYLLPPGTAVSSAESGESVADTIDLAQLHLLSVPGFPTLDPPVPLFELVAESADTLTVRHFHGETEIPRNPQRIVTSLGTAEILISLGVMPLGYASRQDLSPVVREIAPDVIYLPVIDTGPNLEQLAALEPDLIIGYSFLGGNNPQDYDLISQIAPTVVFNDWPAYNWQDSTRQIAQLLGDAEQAETVIADYNARVAQIRREIAPDFGSDTVSALLFFDTPWLYSPMHASPDGERLVYSANVGWVYFDLGLIPGPEVVDFLAADQDGVPLAFFEIVHERLPDLQADHLIIFPGGYSGAEEISESYVEYTQSALWQTLPAVQQDQVYVITGVNRPGGYYSLLDVMERLARAVEESR